MSPPRGGVATLKSGRGQSKSGHVLTSGHEEVVGKEQLEAEERENDFDREGASVHKVSVEELGGVKETGTHACTYVHPHTHTHTHLQTYTLTRM